MKGFTLQVTPVDNSPAKLPGRTPPMPFCVLRYPSKRPCALGVVEPCYGVVIYQPQRTQSIVWLLHPVPLRGVAEPTLTPASCYNVKVTYICAISRLRSQTNRGEYKKSVAGATARERSRRIFLVCRRVLVESEGWKILYCSGQEAHSSPNEASVRQTSNVAVGVESARTCCTAEMRFLNAHGGCAALTHVDEPPFCENLTRESFILQASRPPQRRRNEAPSSSAWGGAPQEINTPVHSVSTQPNTRWSHTPFLNHWRTSLTPPAPALPTHWQERRRAPVCSDLSQVGPD